MFLKWKSNLCQFICINSVDLIVFVCAAVRCYVRTCNILSRKKLRTFFPEAMFFSAFSTANCNYGFHDHTSSKCWITCLVCFGIENVFFSSFFYHTIRRISLLTGCNCLMSFAQRTVFLICAGYGGTVGLFQRCLHDYRCPATRVGHFLHTLAVEINATNQKVNLW